MTTEAALVSCTVLGLQHGFDWDHVAAISDVTSVQTTPRAATRCGLLYAAGHAGTVGLLGVAVIALRHSIPGEWSAWLQRFVGLTLVLLGLYVASRLFTGGAPMSRGQAILSLFSHHKREDGEPRYGSRSALSLGVLHGIGAETPTQLSMLVIATNMGGLRGGMVGLTVFAAAMFVSNMVLTAAATGVFTVSRVRPALFRWVGVLTAGYSLWIGVVLMTS